MKITKNFDLIVFHFNGVPRLRGKIKQNHTFDSHIATSLNLCFDVRC